MEGRLPRRLGLEGRVPPRPWARVEPGPPSNPYHRAGVEPGPLEGHGCGPNWRGRFHQLVRRVARRGSCWQATVVRSSGSRSRGITGPVPVTWPPLARVEEGHRKVDPPVCGHRIRDGMWASAIRSYGFGAFERSTIGVDSMTRGEGGPAWKQCLRAGLGPAAVSVHPPSRGRAAAPVQGNVGGMIFRCCSAEGTARLAAVAGDGRASEATETDAASRAGWDWAVPHHPGQLVAGI
jgi:hypothetical protein